MKCTGIKLAWPPADLDDFMANDKESIQAKDELQQLSSHNLDPENAPGRDDKIQGWSLRNLIYQGSSSKKYPSVDRYLIKTRSQNRCRRSLKKQRPDTCSTSTEHQYSQPIYGSLIQISSQEPVVYEHRTNCFLHVSPLTLRNRSGKLRKADKLLVTPTTDTRKLSCIDFQHRKTCGLPCERSATAHLSRTPKTSQMSNKARGLEKWKMRKLEQFKGRGYAQCIQEINRLISQQQIKYELNRYLGRDPN